MSKSRKKIFPKPPERLNSKSALLLGKNSNYSIEASVKAIYNQPEKIVERAPLTDLQVRMLARLKK
jgi:hypothetical protein